MNVALSNNLFIAGLQLLTWLFLRPIVWQRFVITLDPALPPHFCLAELHVSHWRKRNLQKLVLAGYLFAPMLLVGCVLLILAGLGRLHQATLVFMLCGYGLACLFGLV